MNVGETNNATNTPGQEWLTLPVIALVTANLAPVYGVLFLGWKVFPLIMLFWLENVIVGGMNILKMIFASSSDKTQWMGKIFIIPFFCLHYGMFTFVHGIFVVGLFGGAFHTGANLPWPRRVRSGKRWRPDAAALRQGRCHAHNPFGKRISSFRNELAGDRIAFAGDA